MRRSPTILRLLRAGCFAAVFALCTAASAAPDRTVVFFGDSLTAGYGLDDPQTQSYPARIQEKVDAAGLRWKVVNAGLSGETSAGGLRRVDWVLGQHIDAFVLALGANDGLRGIDPQVTRANLQEIINRVRSRWPRAAIVIAGMKMPQSMGQDYAANFDRIFPGLAARNSATLIPFLLEGVAAHPSLNQGDGIHPTAAGDALVAGTVWTYLLPILRSAH
ncbi:MAG TPA: arylesterase [Opitutaceae bacterium]|jgi:acyl-CoA thioesterase-1